jgi:Trk K+ transport system NAD-binding subunit
LPIIARAHSEEEIEYLKRHGANLVVMGEHEIAKAMLDSAAGAASLVVQRTKDEAVSTSPVDAEKSAAPS